MAYLENPHVARLRRRLPTTAGATDLYEERLRLDSGSQTDIRTQAEGTLTTLLADPGCKVIVLTGDAGHGKTHLCRVILERQYGCSSQQAMDSLREDKLGHSSHSPPLGSKLRPLRVVPDLSDIDDAAAGAALNRVLLADDVVSIVCANEGRLRYIASLSHDDRVAVFVRTLEEGMRRGITTLGGGVHVINMNFQSVTAPDNSFVAGILADWVADRRRWATCKNCDAAPRCPIYRNHTLLAGDEAPAVRRRQGIEQLLRIMERAGQVLTIRDTLSLVAYAITGSLDCSAVEKRERKHNHRDAERFEFEQILFDEPRSDVVDERLPVLIHLRRWDPGKQAIRELDEAIARRVDETSLVDADKKRRFTQPPRTVKEARNSARDHRHRMQRARRRDFFELECELTRSLVSPGEGRGAVAKDEFSRARRLGFRHYGDFATVVGRHRDDEGLVEIRDRIIQGIHVVQGIRPRADTHLLLTDPAFARAGSRAPVVARQLQARLVRLRPLEETWETHQLPESIDWLPRLVVVDFIGETRMELDLHQFEFLVRAAGGITFRNFHAPTIRRILRQLARLTEKVPTDGEIRVVDGARIRNITVDHGTFKVGDA
jgi:hypothetical protein